ncbi:hypothetical protein [Massilia sp. TSP1-1-2]|uniref:hypothetical protein n=1 Tax=Massilia sp. TSP1-1-2 TaxID=2804649 RepID=UPI003CF1C657
MLNHQTVVNLQKRLILLALLLVCQIAALLAPLRAGWALLTNNLDRALEIIKSYDLLGNALTNGRYNELISTRADRARAQNRRWGCVLCRLLEQVDSGHCARAGKHGPPVA